MEDLSELEDAVFRVPPKEFTAARDALAAALKKAGRADEAKAVKGWRRPTVPVWLWNRQVLEGEAAALKAVELATALAEAMGQGASLQKIVGELRNAGAEVVSRGRALAAELGVGLSTAQERELLELVQALPWSETSRTDAARGRLHEQPAAVDPLEAMRVLAGAAPLGPEPPEEKENLLEKEAETARADLAEAEAAHQSAVFAVERAQAQVARAEKQLDDARHAVKEAEREASERAKSLAEARERCDAAEAALKS